MWREGSYEDGRRTGVWKTWHQNGQLREEVRYTEGKVHGPFSARHANGGLHESGAHAAGRRVGTWRRFDPSAELVEEWAYDDCGRLHGRYLTRDRVTRAWIKGRFVGGALQLTHPKREALATRLRQEGNAGFLHNLLPTAEGVAPLLRMLIVEQLLDPNRDTWLRAELSKDPHAGRVVEKTFRGDTPIRS